MNALAHAVSGAADRGRALSGPVRFRPAARQRGVAKEGTRPRSLRDAVMRVGATWLTLATLFAPGPGVAADTDWPHYGNDGANQRFSPLLEINSRNVGRLEPAWTVRTGSRGSFQATPIVHEGVMIVTLPFNDVLALDAATGVTIWRYRHRPTTTETCCGPANRGAAVAHGRVYFVTIDARFIALDLADGSVLWDHPITDVGAGRREDPAAIAEEGDLAGARVVGGTGYSANMAPQVANGLVFVGITGAGYGLHLDVDRAGESTLSVVGLSGGGHGLRGFLVAYDALTGEERWRWYTVSGPDWTGFWTRTTPDGSVLERDIAAEKANAERHREAWRRGGGSVWTTPAIDPELGLLYVGTGNPAPQMDDSTRPGDNRDTVSIVALDMETGEKRWAYQQVPHDRWGYDVASPPVLFEVRHEGERVPALAQAGKTGWVYVLDRRTGRFLYKSAPFVPQRNLFKRPRAEGVTIAPGIYGGASWSPMAYHPGLEYLYVLGIHYPTTYFEKRLAPTAATPWEGYTYTRMAAGERWGTVTAIEAGSGAIAWQRRTPRPLVGGVLATAGHLLFFGEGSPAEGPAGARGAARESAVAATGDADLPHAGDAAAAGFNGRFNALDARTGRSLWSYPTRAGVNAPPITYEVEGVQYVAVAAGGNSLFRFATGDEILAFRLPWR